MSSSPSRRGRLSLALSLLLGAVALGGAACALLVDEGSVMVVLAASACVAFVGLISAFLSLRGARLGPPLAAIVGSLVVLAAIAVAFGAVSLERVMDAVQNPGGPAHAVADPEFAFDLTPPEPNATMYDEVSVVSVNERARAGFWLDADVTGLVFVERVHAPLADAAEAELYLALGDDVRWQSEPSAVRFRDRDAVRVRRRIGSEELAREAESTFFERDGWLFHLYAVGPAAGLGPDAPEPWFPEVLDAFVERDEEIAYEPDPPFALQERGSGWRVRENVYEDAAWGLSLEAPPGFALRWGARSIERDSGWLVSLEQRRPDAWVSIRPAHEWEPDLGPSSLDATAVPDPEAPAMERSVLGVPTQLEGWTWTRGYVQRARFGVAEVNGRRYAVLSWSPSREVADEAIDAALSRLRPIDRDTRAALSLGLPMQEIGARYWARGETMSFLDTPVVWERPSRGWRPLPPGMGLIGEMSEPSRGLRAQLEALEQGESSVEDLLRESLVEVAPDLRVEALPAGRYFAPGVPFSSGEVMAGCALGWNGTAYLLFVWGGAAAMQGSADEVRAACEGLRLSNEPNRVGFDESRRWVDPQLGFAFQPPPDAHVETTWRELDGGVGRLLHVDDGGDTIALLARPESPYEAPADMEARLLGEHYPWASHAPAEVTSREGELGGVPCHVREHRAPFQPRATTVVRLTHEGVVFVLIVDGPARTVDPEEVMARFELL